MAKRNSGEPLSEEDKKPINKSSLRRLREIFKFMLPYKGLFIVGIIALVLSNVSLLMFPRLSGELLDIASGKPKYFSNINQAAVALMLILLVQAVFAFVRVYTFAQVTERGIADIRKSVYQKIIWMPFSFFDQRRVGELMSRITSDVD